MQIDLAIERQCESCDGSGNDYDRKRQQVVIGGCCRCKGVGIELTELGQQVLAAVARYYKLELRESVGLGLGARISQSRESIPNPLAVSAD